ncbi:MAG: phosphatidate cytidylyltransferase, partial [Eggerthellaceae bacterium]|nr:phosphatidate cytidylyltransferase [Eggerthellaceae bacterium]
RIMTGLVYTFVTIVCVLCGTIPMTIMLMAVAGICAGEFYFMLRNDAKLPNETIGIISSILYLPAVYFWGLLGGMIVALVSVIALLVWYV